MTDTQRPARPTWAGPRGAQTHGSRSCSDPLRRVGCERQILSRPADRAIIASIVGVVAIHDDSVTIGGGLRMRVKLALAVITAVYRIRTILQDVELVGSDDFMTSRNVPRFEWRSRGGVQDGSRCRP